MSSSIGGTAAIGAASSLPGVTESLRTAFTPLLRTLEQMKTATAYTYMLELMFTLARLDASLQEEERRLFVCAYDMLIEGLVRHRRQLAEKHQLLKECAAFLEGLRERCGVLQEVCEARVWTVAALRQRAHEESSPDRQSTPAEVPSITRGPGAVIAPSAAQSSSSEVPPTASGRSLLSRESPLLLIPYTHRRAGEGPLPGPTLSLVSSAWGSSFAESGSPLTAAPMVSHTPLSPDNLTDSLVLMANASFTTRNPQSCSTMQSVLRENFKRKLTRGTAVSGSSGYRQRPPGDLSTYLPEEHPDSAEAHGDAEGATRVRQSDVGGHSDPAEPASSAGEHSPLWCLPGHLHVLAGVASNENVAAAVRTATLRADAPSTDAPRSHSPPHSLPDAPVTTTTTTRASRGRHHSRRPPSLFAPSRGARTCASLGASVRGTDDSMLAPITPSAALAATGMDGGTSRENGERAPASGTATVVMEQLWEEVFWSLLTGHVGIVDMEALLALLLAGSPARVEEGLRPSRDAGGRPSRTRPQSRSAQQHPRRDTVAPSAATSADASQPLGAAELCLRQLQASLRDSGAVNGGGMISSLHWDFWVAIQTSLVVLLEGLLYGTEAEPTAVGAGSHDPHSSGSAEAAEQAVSSPPPPAMTTSPETQSVANRLLHALPLPSTAALDMLRTLCPSLRSYSAGLEAVTALAPVIAARVCDAAVGTAQSAASTCAAPAGSTLTDSAGDATPTSATASTTLMDDTGGTSTTVLGFTSDLSRLAQGVTAQDAPLPPGCASANALSAVSPTSARDPAASRPRDERSGARRPRDREGASLNPTAGGGAAGGADGGAAGLPPLPSHALVPADVIMHFFVSALSWEVVLTDYAHQQEKAMARLASAPTADDVRLTLDNSMGDVPLEAVDGAENTGRVLDGEEAAEGRPSDSVKDSPAPGHPSYANASFSSNNNNGNILGTIAAASQLMNFSFTSVQSAGLGGGGTATTPVSTPAVVSGGGGGTFPAGSLTASFFASRPGVLAQENAGPPESFYSYVSALGTGAGEQLGSYSATPPPSLAHSVAGLGGRVTSTFLNDEASTADNAAASGEALANVSFASTTLDVAFEMKRLVEQHLQLVRRHGDVGEPAPEERTWDDVSSVADRAAAAAAAAPGVTTTAPAPHDPAACGARPSLSSSPQKDDGLLGVVIPAMMAAEVDDLLTRVRDALDALEHMENQVCGEITLVTFRVVSTLLDWLIPAVYVADRRTWLYYRKWVCDAYRLLLEEGLLERFADMLDPTHGGVEGEGLHPTAVWHGMTGEADALTPPEPATSPVQGPLPTSSSLPTTTSPPPMVLDSTEGTGVRAADGGRDGTAKAKKKADKKKSKLPTTQTVSPPAHVGPSPSAVVATRTDDSAAVSGTDGMSPAAGLWSASPQSAEKFAVPRADPHALVVPGCAVEIVEGPYRPGEAADNGASPHKGSPRFGADGSGLPAGVRAARALLDQGTRLRPPRHFLLTRPIAATVRGLGEDVIVYLLASLFTPHTRGVSPRQPSLLDLSTAGDEDGGGASGVEMRRDTSDRAADHSRGMTPLATTAARGADVDVEDDYPLSRPQVTMPDFSDVHGAMRGDTSASSHAGRSRSHSVGDMRDALSRSGRVPARDVMASSTTNTASVVDVPALVHHHRFRYPTVHTSADVSALYQEAIDDAELSLSPHDPVYAAMVLNAADFHVRQGQLRDAHNLIEDYLVDVDEERVQLPRLAMVPVSCVADSLSRATTASGTTAATASGGIFSVTSVRGARVGPPAGGRRSPLPAPSSPPQPALADRGAGTVAGRHVAPPTVSVPSAGKLSASDAASRALPSTTSAADDAVVRVPALIPSWGSSLEKDQFLQLLLLLKKIDDELQARMDVAP